MNEYGFNTGLLHGTNEKYPQGATQVPIYQSSAFRHDSAEDLEKIFDNKKMGFSYTRINNPTVESFEYDPLPISISLVRLKSPLAREPKIFLPPAFFLSRFYHFYTCYVNKNSLPQASLL